MCRKQPGRRCSGYEAKRLARAKQRSTGSSADLQRVASVQADFDATPAGIAALRQQAGEQMDQAMLERYRCALARRGTSLPNDSKHARVQALVPRDYGDYGQYYSQNDAKHFGDSSIAGSKFTDPALSSTEDVLELARRQRGSVDGDDRGAFIAAGSSPEAFRPGIRYLMVRTPGTAGIIHSSALDANTPVRVTRDKVGAPCSASVDVDAQPATDYACVVIGRGEDGRELVYTTFPGPPTTPGTGTLDAFEGQTLSVRQIREIFGCEIHLLTRVRG